MMGRDHGWRQTQLNKNNNTICNALFANVYSLHEQKSMKSVD